ncbi:HEPN domain-containing protein [Bacillus sp. ME78]|uniref:HEPN domain-containing protein n=1 Tax=Bacillus sp. ME78 TaxID=2744261 RepID=UPI001603658E|nr:HEPN domain-containing protein [Bacillus sp. ME78]
MSKFFKEAATKAPVSLPVDYFRNAYVYQQIFQYKPEQFLSALLFESNEIKQPYFLLTGYLFIEKQIVSLTIEQAVMSLKILIEKINNYEDIKIEKLEIEQAIQKLLEFDVSKLDREDDLIVKLTNGLVVILSTENNLSSKYEMQIQVCKDNTLNPAIFNFVGSQSADDYGEIYIQDIDSLNLKSLHLLNEIFIDIDICQGNGMQRQYICMPIKVETVNRNTAKIIFTSSSYHLKNSRMPFTVTKASNPFNVFDFVGRHSGFDVHIEGFEKQKHSYTVYILIQNLKIETDLCGIGNVAFYEIDSIEDDIEEMRNILREKFQGDSIAKVTIEAETSYDAYNLATNQIECALNALNHIIKQDSLYRLYSVEESLTEWNRDLLVPKPTLTTIVHIINNVTGELMTVDTNHVIEPTKLSLDENIMQKIEQLNWYEDIITRVMDKETDKEIESIFNSLKWLKRSWDANNIEDQIIFSNITIEFLLSDEKVPPLIKKSLRKCIVEAAIDVFKLNFDGSNEEQERLSFDLKNKFSTSLTNAPLFVKLENLIQRLQIPITDEDMKLLKKVRDARNALVHGRGMPPLEKNELWKVNSIIGMLIAFKLKDWWVLNECS